MASTVTIAVVGDPAHAFEMGALDWRAAGSPDFEIPWEERTKVRLSVEPDEPLASMIDRAARELDIRSPRGESPSQSAGFISFYSDQAHSGFPGLRHELTLVDAEGRAHWGVWNWKAVTHEELLRAYEAGALVGDPGRPYLILLPGVGNGPIPDWVALLHGLREVLGVISDVGGTVAFAALVVKIARDRLSAGHKAIEDRHDDWSDRDARPDNFEQFLKDGAPWHTGQLAQLLRSSEDESKAILWAYGFAEAPSGLWRPEEDDASRLIRGLHSELKLSYSWHPQDWSEFDKTLRTRAETLLETGQAPPRSTDPSKEG